MDSVQNALVSSGSFGSVQSLAEQAKSGDPRSIDRVAADFESLFVSMVLKEMRQTLEPETLFGSEGSDSYGGLFDFYLGQHIAESGGFGVAQMVRQNLERRVDSNAPQDAGQNRPASDAS